jgi:AAA+ superfamily predicted ATPase
MSKEVKEGKFVVTKVTNIEDLAVDSEIQESDLLVKNDTKIVQFKYVEPEKKNEDKVIAKPGVYNITTKGSKIILGDLELRNKNLLTSYDNTSKILNEADNFFKHLEKYRELEVEEKRAILLYSPPGYGKTSAITRTIENLIKEDKNTIAINWPTSEIRSSDANRFLASIDYKKEGCTRLVLVIEDIGGGEQEDYNGRERGIDSSLLNLLDGVDNTFSIPTFIIATTNHPGSLLDALADRPGRFDEYIELDPPTEAQRIELVEFISKRPCTVEEKEALKLAKDFSPAHLAEVVKRSILKGQTYADVVDKMVNHKTLVSKRFEKNKTNKMGLGLGAK